jgi:hypothetical protein
VVKALERLGGHDPDGLRRGDPGRREEFREERGALDHGHRRQVAEDETIAATVLLPEQGEPPIHTRVKGTR